MCVIEYVPDDLVMMNQSNPCEICTHYSNENLLGLVLGLPKTVQIIRLLTWLMSLRSPMFFTRAARKTLRSKAEDALAPIIMPICWLRKNTLIVVAKWLLSTAAESPMN